MRSMETPPVPHSAPPVRNPDEEHLKILSICHWIGAGFAVLGLLFLVLHFAIMRTVFMNPEAWDKQPGGGPPPQLFAVMKMFYLFGALVMIALGVLNAMSARFLAMRRNRMFSMVVAGLNCLQVPIGTVLGVFTFIVLGRPSVVRMYEESEMRIGTRY